MNFPDQLLPSGLQWTAHLAFLPILVWAARLAPWRRLARPMQLHAWFGTIVFLMVLWSIKTGIRPGLNFHLLGATAFTLMFGPALAIVGLTLVLLGVTLAGMAGWSAFSVNALLMGVLPVMVSWAIYRMVETRLPNHFFVYVFLSAFLSGGLVMLATGAIGTFLLAASGAYPLPYLYSEYLPYYMLMAWAEALTTGMTITLLVVYHPDKVGTFDDARYLRDK